MTAQEEDFRFEHRPNRDGTLDSICMECFETVAFDLEEQELEQFESDHVCATGDGDHPGVHELPKPAAADSPAR
jgi:hypothetical protein